MSDVIIDRVRLVKNGTIQTHDKGSLIVNTTSWKKYYVGGSTDLWDNTWSKSDIENTNFGVAINSYTDSMRSGYGSVRSKYLKSTNFGFDLGTSPNIKGITVEFEARIAVYGDDTHAEIRYVKIWVHTLEGSGTSLDPYLIKNWWDLDMIRSDLTSYYKLSNNIDMTTDGYDDIGVNWVAIDGFDGELDGDGHTISDIVLNASSIASQGLFGNILSATSCTIKNLGIINSTFSNTGGSTSGTMAVSTFIGRVVGDVTLTNCYARNCDITASGSFAYGGVYASGLIGYRIGGIINIQKCYAVCETSATNTGEFGAAASYGIIAQFGGTGSVDDTFWNTDVGAATDSSSATGKTTAQMKNISTYTDTATTGLTTAWSMASTSSHTTQTWFLGSDMGFELYPQLYNERKFLYGNALVEDFESGSYTDGVPITWTETGSALTVSSTTPINGTYSLRETSPANDSRSIEYTTAINITDDVILGSSFKGTTGDGAWGFFIEYTFANSDVIDFKFTTVNTNGYLFGTLYSLTVDRNFTRIEFENSGSNIRAKAYNREGTILAVSDWKTRTSDSITKVKITRNQPNSPPSGTNYIDDIIYGYTSGTVIGIKIAGTFADKPLMIKKSGTFEQVGAKQVGGWV